MVRLQDGLYRQVESLKSYPGGRKNDLISINISCIATLLVSLYTVYQVPSNEPSLSLLAWFLPMLAYLSL